MLHTMHDSELIRRNRLDRAGIVFVTDLIKEKLTSPTPRRNAIAPEIKVITTLRYLATGKMQLCSSDDLGPSQPSITRVITQTITALSDPLIVSQVIAFPLDIPTLQAQKTAFMHIAGFPGVVGVIGETHVQIIAPSEDEDDYVNRKMYHSINVQVVFSADYKILDIVDASFTKIDMQAISVIGKSGAFSSFLSL